MKSYTKLLNFELGRFMKIYLVLMGITIVSQLVGAVISANSYMSMYEESVFIDGMTLQQFVEQYSQISLMSLTSSAWFNLPIVFAAAALIFYSFFIWYRDWLGKNTFIYRLLTLPTARLNIYLSKATAIFLMVFGLVALQVLLIIVQGNILKWLVPANLRIDYTVMGLITNSVGDFHLSLLIPANFVNFLFHYGTGFMVVFVLFTAILFERSYRLKGFVYGILYAVFSFGIFLLPTIILGSTQKNYLFPSELLVVEIILWAVVTSMSVFVGNYLLNKKITV